MLFLANFSERLLYRFIWIQRGSLHYLKHFECACSDFSFYILPSFFGDFFWWNLLFFKVCLAKKKKERQEKTHNPAADVFCNSSLLRTQHQLHPGPQQSNSLQMLTKLAECWAFHWSLVKIYSTKKDILIYSAVLQLPHPPVSLEAVWISGSTVGAPCIVVSSCASQHTGMQWLQCHFPFLELARKIPLIICFPSSFTQFSLISAAFRKSKSDTADNPKSNP